MRATLRALAALLMLAAAAAQPAVAQAVVGAVRDQERDLPIPGARLYLLTDAGAVADSVRADRNGRYRLTAASPGEHVLVFHLDGWATVTSDPVVLNDGAPTQFEFRVPLIGSAAIRQMSDVISTESRLQDSLPEICGEPFRAWEAGLLVGTVRSRATGTPIAGARVSVGAPGTAGARSTVSSENGVYVLCNVPLGGDVTITAAAPDGTRESTTVEIRPGTASWYDLPLGPRRR